tara:strand:+ start:1188 stop:1370 length:183 start_codon:yes stop_codon:yes gene_type:complete
LVCWKVVISVAKAASADAHESVAAMASLVEATSTSEAPAPLSHSTTVAIAPSEAPIIEES